MLLLENVLYVFKKQIVRKNFFIIVICLKKNSNFAVAYARKVSG